MIKLFLLSLLIVNILIPSIRTNYCSAETCRRCCQALPTGCMNTMDYNIRVNYFYNFNLFIKGRYVSYLTFCRDCDCDDPSEGCGWKASNFGRIECTSCSNLDSMNNENNVIDLLILDCDCWMWTCSLQR